MKHFIRTKRILMLSVVVLGLFLSFQNCALDIMSKEALMGKAAGDGAKSSASVTAMSEAEIVTSKANAILAAKCQSCHNPQMPSGDFDVTNLDQMFYLRDIVPGEPNLSGLFNAVADGLMPQAPSPRLSASEIQIIFDWIQIGFTNVPTTTTGVLPDVTPNYASIYARILAPRCLSCHGTNQMIGGISFSNYNSTRATLVAGNPAGSALYRSVSTSTGRGGRMPQGQTALSNAELSAIQTWIQQGALNN